MDSVELIPGGAPQDLRLTVRNTGKSKSEPVTASLNLPQGVRAIGADSPNSMRLNAASASSGKEVRCPGGTGTVRCETGAGLAPGESVVLVFRLQADQDAKGGTVTGSINAGTTVRTSVQVPVRLRPRPDALGLVAYPVSYERYKQSVKVIATNNGGSAKPIELDLNEPAFQAGADEATTCRHTYTSTHCRTGVAVRPGEQLVITLHLLKCPPAKRSVTVSAELGTASASRTVEIGYSRHPGKGTGNR
jgi:hypothetical protein